METQNLLEYFKTDNGFKDCQLEGFGTGINFSGHCSNCVVDSGDCGGDDSAALSGHCGGGSDCGD